MRVRLAPLVLVLALVSPARADEPHSISPEEIDEVAAESRFVALVAKGDHERARGRLFDAAMAYSDAMKVRRDPVVAGRLGLLLIKLDQAAQAVELLQFAVKHARTNPAEREAFWRAFDTTRALGAWIDVVISHAGTRVTLDGKQRNQAGHSAFSMFVLAGEHVLHATLEGHADAVATFKVIAGEDMQVPLTLSALEPPAPPQKIELPPLTAKRVPSLGVMGEFAHGFRISDPRYTKQEDPYAYEDPVVVKPEPEEKGRRGSIGGGPVVVFGVASWMPAVGVVVEGRWRANDYLSLGLEGRAAWLTTGVGDGSISAMTAGGIASGCAHVKWFVGCVIGHLGVINVEASPTSYEAASFSFLKPGLGGRVGGELSVARSLIVKASVDTLGLPNGLQVSVGQTRVADQPPVLVGAQRGAAWEF